MENPVENEVDNFMEIKLPPRTKIDFEDWLGGMRGLAMRTKLDYTSYIKKMLRGKEKITIKEIETFLMGASTFSSLEKIERKSNPTVPKNAAVKLFMKFIKKYNKLKNAEIDIEYPLIKKNRDDSKHDIKKRQEPINRKELKLLIDTFKKDIKENWRLYDYSFFTEVMFSLGLRISECVKIRNKDILFESWDKDRTHWGGVNIINTKTKDRTVPVDPIMMQKFKDNMILDEKKEFVREDYYFDFGFKRYLNRRTHGLKKKKYSPEGKHRLYVRKVVKSYPKILQEVSDKCFKYKLKTHTFRASRATELDSKNVRLSLIREFLGHENLATTSKYLRPSLAQLKEELMEKDR